MTIAIELGVSRKRVRLACERLNLESQPDGPRRGVPAGVPPAPVELDATEQAFRRRYHEAKRRRTPQTVETFRAALKAAHDAQQAGDPNAEDQAWIDIAAAACLIHDHRRKLRAA